MNAYWEGDKFCLGNVVVGRIIEFDDATVSITNLPSNKGRLLGKSNDVDEAKKKVEDFTRTWLQEIRK